MAFIFFFIWVQIDSNTIAYEIQMPFDVEAKIYEIDSSLAQKIEFFKSYPTIQKALLFLQSDSSYVIELYSKKEIHTIKERVNVGLEEISKIQQEIAEIKAKERPKGVYDRSGYAKFLGNSFLLAYAVQAPLMVMALSPDDARISAAVYMLFSASGFVIPLIATKNSNVSKAHASMYSAGGIHGLYVGGALSEIVGMDVFNGTGALLTAGGSVIGEYVGFKSVDRFNLSMGRGNTISLIGDFTGATAAGLLSLFDDWSNSRFKLEHYLSVSIIGLGSGLYLGSEITKNLDLADGDPLIFGYCGITGAASLPVILSWFENERSRISGKMYISAGIAGLGLGSILGNRIVRDKNFTESEGNIITLGGLAGALTSAGLVSLSGTNNPKVYWTGVILGDIIGAIATASFIKTDKPKRELKLNFHPESMIGAGLCYKNNIPFRKNLITYRF